MAKLQFNETTYEFKIQRTKENNNNNLVEKQGAVLINGKPEYVLWYSYNPHLDNSQALYEVFTVDDTDATQFMQYGKQGFPFYMVQSMVSHIMNNN